MTKIEDVDKQQPIEVCLVELDPASLAKTAKADFFADVPEEPAFLFNAYPDPLRYPANTKLGYRNVSIPSCLKNTILHKVIAHEIRFWKGEECTLAAKAMLYLRIFQQLQGEPRVDEKLLGAQFNDAIKSMQGRDGNRVAETQAKIIQGVFLGAINAILKGMHSEFNDTEIRALREIQRMTPVFASVTNKPTDSINQRYPQLPYTNADYIHSIRQVAFVQYTVWNKIRSRFKTEYPDAYIELHGLLIEKRMFFDRLANSIVSPEKYEKNNRDDTFRIQSIMINAALKLKDPILIESLFLPIAYRRINIDHGFMFRNKEGPLTLNPRVTIAYMSAYLTQMLNDDGTARSNGRWLKRRDKVKNRRLHSGCLSTFTPYALLLPFGPDELTFYAALFATERCQTSTLLGLKTADILLLESNGKKGTKVNHAPKLKINGFKGRNGKKDGSIYTKGSPFYSVARGLKDAFNEAVESGLIPTSNYCMFKSLSENDVRFSVDTFFGGNLQNKKKISPKARLIIPLIPGSYYHAVMQKHVDNSAFLVLLQSLLGRSEDVGKRILSPSNITQSRIYAEQAQDLSDFEVSESVALTYSEDLYARLSVVAPTQHHTVETRLNTYYLRSQDRVVAESREKFAAQVGEEMVKMAVELAGVKSLEGELLDLHTAQTVCGLAPAEIELSAEELIAQADAQGYVVNETGFIKRNGTTYIIKSPLHARLIQRKIEHIDDEVEHLMFSNHHLVPRAIAQRMLLNLILNQFDETTIAEGQKIYGHVEFQFPSLMIISGGF
ncbi:MAG: hypothetical protein GYB20_01865 [Oceanospirillales bacterium]|nr:hypothetical protein [Oceanospirillales bacterium]